MLEINQKNFELFKEQIDSAVKLTSSSIDGSDAARQTLAAMNSLSQKIDGNMSSGQLDPSAAAPSASGEHQIEVINIS